MFKKLISCIFAISFLTSLIGCNTNSIENLEKEILVNTTYPEEVMKFISTKFFEETGITINYKIVDSIDDELNDNPNVDFIMGGDKNKYIDLVSKGILKPVKTSWFNDENIQERDKEGQWYSIARDPIILISSKQFSIKSWLELANVEFKDKIVMENTRKIYIQDLLADLMYQYYKINNEPEGLIYYQNLKNNILSFKDDMNSVFESLKNKESFIGVTTLEAYIKSDIKDQVKVLNTIEGSPISIQCAAILNTAQHPNSSELFMEFIAGPRMQVELAKEFNIIPSNLDAQKYSGELINKINELTIMDVDNNIIHSNKDKWINEFNNIVKNTPEQETKINKQ